MEENRNPKIDPETQVRLNLLLEAAGINESSESIDGRFLPNHEVLSRLTANVSKMLDEATARLAEMKPKKSREFDEISLKSPEKNVEVPTKSDLETAHGLETEESSVYEITDKLTINPNVEDGEIKGDCKIASKDPHH